MFEASSGGGRFWRDGERHWRPVAERGVWTLCVVMDAPFLNDHLGLPEAGEEFAIQTFIPELAVEGFTEPILPR